MLDAKESEKNKMKIKNRSSALIYIYVVLAVGLPILAYLVGMGIEHFFVSPDTYISEINYSGNSSYSMGALAATAVLALGFALMYIYSIVCVVLRVRRAMYIIGIYMMLAIFSLAIALYVTAAVNSQGGGFIF